MDVHFNIPFGSKFFIESFRFPSLGKLLHRFRRNTVDIYANINFGLIGYKEELLNNRIKVDENDLAAFKKLKKLLGFVERNTIVAKDEQLHQINQYALSSVETIEEILKITEDKLKYKLLKDNIHEASVDALNAHLNKYPKTI